MTGVRVTDDFAPLVVGIVLAGLTNLHNRIISVNRVPQKSCPYGSGSIT
jgi:hypothetical protein